MSTGVGANPQWWQSFFDDDYVRVWGDLLTVEETAAQVEGLWALLKLQPGSRMLDAGCGYGRLSRPLAERGAIVVGVDQSSILLAHAEHGRGELPESRLRYVHHDLRQRLAETGFDAACNVFTAIGYGSDNDDLEIFRTLHDAVRPGGLVLIETNHRDTVAAFLSRGALWGKRRPNGTVVVEEPAFDPIAGRVNTTWYWAGPEGSGQKSASVRVYCATELVALLQRAGLRLVSANRGLSAEPFKTEGPEAGGRLCLVTERPL